MRVLDVLFISGDIGGNVPPTRAIAHELVRRGHRVSVAGIRPRPGDSPQPDIEEIPLAALSDLDVTRRAGPLGHIPALRRLAMGRAMTRDVRELIGRRNPDVAVVDAVALTSLREALRAGLPTAALFHSLGAFWDAGMSGRAVNVLLRPMGISPLALLEQAGARLLPTDRELDPAGDGRPRIAFDWLGTTERALPPAPRTSGTPRLVLVSLSTAWQRGQGDVYRRIIAGLALLEDDGVRGIVTTGGAEVDGPLRTTRGVEVRGRSPHAEIMPHADLVIGHGGHSTTMRALAHGLPLVVMPLDRTSDQPLIGRVVESAGLGRVLTRDATPDAVADTVRGMLSDTTLRERAARTGERLRRQRGAEAGADRIEAIARTA